MSIYLATPELRFCMKMVEYRDPYDPAPLRKPDYVLQQRWVSKGKPDEWRDVPYVIDEALIANGTVRMLGQPEKNL